MTSPAVRSRPAAVARRAATAGLCLLLALLAACSGTLLPQPPQPPARFTLDAGGAMPAAPGALPSPPTSTQTVAVALPRAAPGYDSRHMLYQRRPQELEAFAFHEWVEAPAQMLAPLLVRALQHSGAFRVVLLAPSTALTGWRLESELIRLHQDFGSRPSQLRLGLRAVLLDVATRQVIAWREFELGVPAAGDDPVAGVRAAHEATQQLTRAVAAFCAEQAALAAPQRATSGGRPGG
jgi:cholesterol transport system auxiliary component